MRKHLLFFALILLFLNINAQKTVHGFEMGSKQDEIAKNLKDISNPQSWEETRFEYDKPISLFGVEASKTELAFWNKRLYEVKINLPIEAWDIVKSNLDNKYGKAWIIDSLAAEKSGQWGETNNGVAVFQISGIGTVLTFKDETQKEFQFTDLFKGSLLYVIIAIVGLFVLNMTIGWLLTSYCKKCKSFNMKLVGKDWSNMKDYSTGVLDTPDFHHDTTYKYKCTKCGHARKDRYSGFWSYMRSKD